MGRLTGLDLGSRERSPGFSITSARRRAIVHGLLIAGLIFNAVLVVFWLPDLYLFIDAEAWAAIDLNNLYGPGEASLAIIGAFRYSPAVAWLFVPLSWLPWPVLVTVYTGLGLAALVALTGRTAPLFLVAFPPVLLELVNANVHLLMALAIWAGMRWPGAWAFLFLTKVTPGVGVVWFAARREWRNLALALGTTAAIFAAGFAVAPGQWLDWLRSLANSAGQAQVGDMPSLLLRLPVAAGVVWYAARTDRAWLVPVGCLLAMPTIWLQSSALLTACFPLWWDRARWQRARATAKPGAGTPEATPAAPAAGAA